MLEAGLPLQIFERTFANLCCRLHAGHGPVIDLSKDLENAKLASTVSHPYQSSSNMYADGKRALQFWQSGKLVAAVCHGPALVPCFFPVNASEALTCGVSRALVRATDLNGNSIFAGRKFTGFSNAEEKAYGLPVGVSQ